MLQPNSSDQTSADTRTRAARPVGADGPCRVTWGICPDHGATLSSSEGRTECRHPDCALTWDYDRFATPCAESATHRVRDTLGGTLEVCPAHAAAIEKQLEGAVVTRLGGA